MSEDQNQPATKADIEELAQITDSAIEKAVDPLREDIRELRSEVHELHQGQDRLEKGQEELRSDVKSLQRGQEAILNVVQSIDEQLKHHLDLPDRVARLERSAFR